MSSTKSKIKRTALKMAKSIGLFKWMKNKMPKQLVVLCYHSVVSDDTPLDKRANIAVTVSQFEQHLVLFKEGRKDWVPISLTDLKDALINSKILPDYSILITFDDGFRNNLTHAAPLLKKYEIPAAVFLTSGHIGTEKLLWTQETDERHRNLLTPDFSMMSVSELKKLPNADRLQYLEELRQHSELAPPQQWQRELYSFMDWDEVHQLRHFGIEIGAHTATHPILSSLLPQEMYRELAESKKKIEQEIGEECFAIAYPNGGRSDFNDTVIEECKDCGFQLGFNLYNQRNPTQNLINPFSIDRLCVTRDLALIELEYMLVKGR